MQKFLQAYRLHHGALLADLACPQKTLGFDSYGLPHKPTPTQPITPAILICCTRVFRTELCSSAKSRRHVLFRCSDSDNYVKRSVIGP